MARSPQRPPPRGDVDRRSVARAGEQFLRLRFFAEVTGELRRVTWPSREQTIRLSGVVIAVSTFIGAVLASADWLFSQGVGALFF